jgi:hypothetical protein
MWFMVCLFPLFSIIGRRRTLVEEIFVRRGCPFYGFVGHHEGHEEHEGGGGRRWKKEMKLR